MARTPRPRSRRVLACAAIACAALLCPAVAHATKVSGAVLFDAPDTRPSTVDLVFTGPGGFPKRTVQISGQASSYAFNLPDGRYTTVDASFPDVAGDAFWLASTSAAIREVPRPLPLLQPLEFRADDLVFTRGIRLALPITDRAGKRFRPPHGWRSRGGGVSVDFGPDVRLNKNAGMVTGIADPADASVTLTLAYSDSFGTRREIGPPTVRFSAPDSARGTTVTEPKIRIDATPPAIRARPVPGRNTAIFVARDRQSGISVIASAAYLKAGKGYRLLSSKITVIDLQDPDHRYVPRGYTGVRVSPGLSGRRTIRYCAANGHGVMPRFSSCPKLVIGG